MGIWNKEYDILLQHENKVWGKFVINTMLFFSYMNIVFQIFPPKLTDCKRFYFVGKFRIRNERIIDSRELDINDMSYLSQMEIKFEVNLLQILCPVKITNISLIKKFPQKCCPGGRSAPPAPTWLRHWVQGFNNSRTFSI